MNEKIKIVWTGESLVTITDTEGLKKEHLAKIEVGDKNFIYFGIFEFKDGDILPSGWTTEENIDAICEDYGHKKEDFVHLHLRELINMINEKTRER